MDHKSILLSGDRRVPRLMSKTEPTPSYDLHGEFTPYHDIIKETANILKDEVKEIIFFGGIRELTEPLGELKVFKPIHTIPGVLANFMAKNIRDALELVPRRVKITLTIPCLVNCCGPLACQGLVWENPYSYNDYKKFMRQFESQFRKQFSAQINIVNCHMFVPGGCLTKEYNSVRDIRLRVDSFYLNWLPSLPGPQPISFRNFFRKAMSNLRKVNNPHCVAGNKKSNKSVTMGKSYNDHICINCGKSGGGNSCSICSKADENANEKLNAAIKGYTNIEDVPPEACAITPAVPNPERAACAKPSFQSQLRLTVSSQLFREMQEELDNFYAMYLVHLQMGEADYSNKAGALQYQSDSNVQHLKIQSAYEDLIQRFIYGTDEEREKVKRLTPTAAKIGESVKDKRNNMFHPRRQRQRTRFSLYRTERFAKKESGAIPKNSNASSSSSEEPQPSTSGIKKTKESALPKGKSLETDLDMPVIFESDDDIDVVTESSDSEWED